MAALFRAKNERVRMKDVEGLDEWSATAVSAATSAATTACMSTMPGTVASVANPMIETAVSNAVGPAVSSAVTAATTGMLATLLGAIYPVGAIYVSYDATNPGGWLPGTWTACGVGKVWVGIDPAQTEFDTAGKTGGAKTHQLTSGEMPSHTHVQNAHTHVQNSHNHTQDPHSHTYDQPDAPVVALSIIATASVLRTKTAGQTTGSTTATNQSTTAVNQNTTAVNQNTGGDGAHNNLQPYEVVYKFRRVA